MRDLLKVLLDLRRGFCWCDVGLGDPTASGHSQACMEAKALVDEIQAEEVKIAATEALGAAFERFSEKDPPSADLEADAQLVYRTAQRRAFWAGAQSTVAIFSAAVADEDDTDAWHRVEAAYDEVAAACEELKL